MDHNGVEDGSSQHQGDLRQRSLQSKTRHERSRDSEQGAGYEGGDKRCDKRVYLGAADTAFDKDAIVKAPAASVKKLRPGIEVVNWITAAEIRP